MCIPFPSLLSWRILSWTTTTQWLSVQPSDTYQGSQKYTMGKEVCSVKCWEHWIPIQRIKLYLFITSFKKVKNRVGRRPGTGTQFKHWKPGGWRTPETKRHSPGRLLAAPRAELPGSDPSSAIGQPPLAKPALRGLRPAAERQASGMAGGADGAGGARAGQHVFLLPEYLDERWACVCKTG